MTPARVRSLSNPELGLKMIERSIEPSIFPAPTLGEYQKKPHLEVFKSIYNEPDQRSLMSGSNSKTIVTRTIKAVMMIARTFVSLELRYLPITA